MLHITYFDKNNLPDSVEKAQIIQFLHKNLDQYGDPTEDIEKAFDYAVSKNGAPGGFVVAAKDSEQLACAVIVNETGMSGYIPENILVYIATDRAQRGKGIGKKVMQGVIDRAKGDIALHVEPDNPAKRLYENLGFSNKYLEMRLKK